MGQKRLLVTTDKGKFYVTVDDGSPSEPDPFTTAMSEGPKTFTDSPTAGDKINGFLKRVADNPALQAVAHPKSSADFAGLLLPNTAGIGSELIDRGIQATKAAGRETSGVSGMLSFPLRAIQKFRDALPSANEAAAEGAGLRNGSVPVPSSPVAAAAPQSDVVDRMLAEQRQATPVARAATRTSTVKKVTPPAPKPVAAAPATLEDTLTQDLTKPTPPASSTPDVGDELRRLGMPEGRYQELRTKFGGEGPSAPPESTVPTQTLDEAVKEEIRQHGGISQEKFQQLQQEFGGERKVSALGTGASTTPEGAGPTLSPDSSGRWHSGVEPGTAEASQAEALHRYTAEMDALYKYKLLLGSLGGAAVASQAPSPQQ